jgi:hypothetical protein
MVRGVVNVSVAAGGGGRAAPNPHAGLHAPTDELHKHPMFQRARVAAGDVGTHSVVVDTNALKQNLRNAMNAVAMQVHLARLDPAAPRTVLPTMHPRHQAHLQQQNTAAGRNPVPLNNNIWVNINFAAPQGLVNEYSGPSNAVVSRQFRFKCLGIKLVVNPRNRDIPVLQTCVPSDAIKAQGFHLTI